MYRRLPKRGFKNRNTLNIVAINLDALEAFEDGATVTVDTLIEKGIIKNTRTLVKVLGDGEITKALTVKVDKVSASAKAKIEAAGGKVEEPC